MKSKDQVKFEIDEKLRFERERHELYMKEMEQQHKNEMETLESNFKLVKEYMTLSKLQREVVLLDK